MSASQVLFQDRERAVNQFTARTGDSLSYLRALSWAFIQSTISEKDSFDFLFLLKNVLSALPSDFNAIFGETRDSTTSKEGLQVFRLLARPLKQALVTGKRHRWIRPSLDFPSIRRRIIVQCRISIEINICPGTEVFLGQSYWALN